MPKVLPKKHHLPENDKSMAIQKVKVHQNLNPTLTAESKSHQSQAYFDDEVPPLYSKLNKLKHGEHLPKSINHKGKILFYNHTDVEKDMIHYLTRNNLNHEQVDNKSPEPLQ
jgi:hypothetical protein